MAPLYWLASWLAGALVPSSFGAIADHLGRVRALIYSILLYAVASGLCATSHNWLELAIFRFLVGVGIGGEINVGVIYLAESWHPKGRSWAISLSQSSFPVGMLLVSMFTYVSSMFSWRWLFLAGTVPALLTLYIRQSLTETKSIDNHVSGKVKEATTRMQMERAESIFNKDNTPKLLLATALGTCAIVGYWAGVAWIPSWIDQISHINALDQKSAATFWMGIGGLAGCFFTPLLIRYSGMSNALRISFFGTLLVVLGMLFSFKVYSPLILLLCLAEGFIGIQMFNLLCIWTPQVFNINLRGTASGITWAIGRLIAAGTMLCSTQLITSFHGSYAMMAAFIAGVCYLSGILLASFVKE